MKKKLYIVGAGSVGGHVALNIGEYSDEFEVEGFFDDDPEKIGSRKFGFKVLGTVKEALDLKNESIVIGIAFPKTKQKILKKVSANKTLEYPSLIHSRAWISKNVSIGKGCIIYPGTTVNYGSVLNDFVVLNMNCSLGHHTTVGDCSSMAPGVNTGGYTTIGEGVDIGIGVSTIQNIAIDKHSRVGGQTMVTKDIPANSKAVGIPAKIIS